MVFVLPPSYEYDEFRELLVYDDLEDALSFIEDDLEKNIKSTFKNGVDDYTVIEGKKIKIKAVDYVSKVVVDK